MAGCLSCAMWCQAFAAEASVVGMVLDLQGPAQATQNGVTGKLQLLAKLVPQMRIELPAGSKASLTIYATRSVYRLSGPTVVQTSSDGLTVLQGGAPEMRRMSERLVAAAQADNLIAGAYRMRSLVVTPPVVLTSPENGTVTLETRPTFRWESEEAGDYVLTLRAESGGLGYSAAVKGKAWSLPEGIALEHGKTYEWKVSYRLPTSGETHSTGGKFSVATRAEAEQVAALRPAEADPIEEWVFYAELLQRRLIRAEARSAWQRIAARRPDLAPAAELPR